MDERDWPPRQTEQRFHLLLLQQHSRTTCQRQVLSLLVAPCLPPPAAHFLFLGSSQPGERSTFLRSPPAKMPAHSGRDSDPLPFFISPPAFETLRNGSLADTVVFPTL